MFCRHCGAEIKKEALLCPRCGAPTAPTGNFATKENSNPNSQQQFYEYGGEYNPPGANASPPPRQPFYKKRWFIVTGTLSLMLVYGVIMMISKNPAESKALDQLQPDHPEVVSEQQRTYGSDEDNLAIGETARYSDYEITLVSVEPYERGDRAYFEIEGKRKTTIKRYWFEGTAATRKTLSIDEASETLDQSLPEEIPLADGQSFNGYVYFEGGGLSSIRFSGGVFSSDRTWNFDRDASTMEQQEAAEYFATLEKLGLTSDESENVRALFNELGIAGCQIDRTEAMHGSGIDELQSFRTWIDINPEDWKTRHGAFEHQINFTFEERRIFYVEITGFVVGSNQKKSYILYNSNQDGYTARYIPESDSVEPW